jgi:molybdopterin-guanine dinucleotide biosynthesis protein A
VIAGIFVGGASARMGGQPKGRLVARDTGEPLIVRTSRLLSALGLRPVLVGDATPYADLVPELARLADQPSGVGPLGGLGALLAAAHEESAAAQHVLAFACDMPLLSQALIAKLAQGDAAGDVLAPRGDAGFWEPLCARYRIAPCSPALSAALAAGERSFRALFQRLHVVELMLSASERGELRDWDTPEDVHET